MSRSHVEGTVSAALVFLFGVLSLVKKRYLQQVFQFFLLSNNSKSPVRYKSQNHPKPGIFPYFNIKFSSSFAALVFFLFPIFASAAMAFCRSSRSKSSMTLPISKIKTYSFMVCIVAYPKRTIQFLSKPVCRISSDSSIALLIIRALLSG